MLTIGGLLIFLKHYIVRTLAGPVSVPWDETVDSDLDDDDDDDKEKVNIMNYLNFTHYIF